jgi:outer membrane protein
MKIHRLIVASIFLAASVSISISAQQNTRSTAPGVRAATPAPTAAATAIPDSKIAFVNTEAFSDEKQGITRYVNALKTLDREFQPRRTELQNLQGRIKAIADDISKTSNLADEKALAAKRDQGEALQRELEFKNKEAEAAFQKRSQEVLSPISDDIGKALDAFARARGITLLLDISKLVPAVITANPAMDMTSAFISEYNSRTAAR